MRIGIFVACLPPELRGGTEIQAERMARELAARGHEVHVFARRQSTRPEPDRGGVTVWRRPVLSLPFLRPLGELVLGVRQALAVHCDVLLCYIALNSGVLGWLTTRLSGVPCILWIRGVDEVQVASRPGIRSRVCLFLFQRVDELWLQSRTIARQLRQELERLGALRVWERIQPRIRVVANGLDVPPERHTAVPAPDRFVFVGRLSPEKDFDTLFRAVELAGSVSLDVVGDGVLRPQLEERADARRVSFHGSLDRQEIDAFLARARGLILCSTLEGLPNAVLEALASGVPVIATAVGSVPEIVHDGENGFLVQPGDSRAIADRMLKLQDEILWRRLSEQARRSVEAFSWSRLVPEVEGHLQALASARTERRRSS